MASFDADVNLQFERAVSNLSSAIERAVQGIEVAFNVSHESLESMKAKYDKFFRENAIVLDVDTAVNNREMKEYCDTLIRNLEREIASNPKNKDILSGVLSDLRKQVSAWASDLNADFTVKPTIKAKDFEDHTASLAAVIGEAHTQWERFNDAVSKSTSFDEARNKFSSFVNGTKRNIEELERAIRAYREKVTALPEEQRGKFESIIRGYEEKLDTLRKAQQFYEQKDEYWRREPTEENKEAYLTSMGQVEAAKNQSGASVDFFKNLNDSFGEFAQKKDEHDELGRTLNMVTEKLRELNMAGVPVPRMLTNIISYTTQLHNMAKLAQSWGTGMRSWSMGRQVTGGWISGGILREHGLAKDQVVADAQGKMTKLADVITKARQDTEKDLSGLMLRARSKYFERHQREMSEEEAQAALRRIRIGVTRLRAQGSWAGSSRQVQVAAARATGRAATSWGGVVGGIGRGLAGLGRGLATFGGLATAGAVGFVGALVVGYFKALWARQAELFKQSTELQKKAIALTSGLQISSIQHISQLRIEGLKHALELDKQRVTLNRELLTSSMTMTAAELASRQKLLEIDQKRLEAQKQGELLSKRASQISDITQKYDEYSNSMDEGRGTATRYKSVGRMALAYGTLSLSEWIYKLYQMGANKTDILRDEQGRTIDASISRVAGKKFNFASAQDMAIASMLNTASTARTVMKEQYKSEFDQIVANYQNFTEIIASSQVGDYSYEFKKSFDAFREENEKMIADMSKNQDKYAAIMAYMNGFDESLKTGVIQFDRPTGQYMFTDQYGTRQALGGTEEEAAKRFKFLSGGAMEDIQDMRERQKTLDTMKLQQKTLELRGKREQDILYVQQELLKKEEEAANAYRSMLKNTGMTFATSAFDVTLAEDLSVGVHRGNGGLEKTLGFLEERRNQWFLDDPRFRRGTQAGFTPEDKEALEMRLAADKRYMEKRAEVEKRTGKELKDLQYKHEVDLYKLEHDHIVALFSLWHQNLTKLHQMEIDNRKTERELLYKVLDKQLQSELLGADMYGKTQLQISLERRLLAIESKFDREQATLETRARTEKVETEVALSNVSMLETQQMKRAQQQELADLEMEQVRAKGEAELALIEAQHKLAMKNIQIEVEYRYKLNQLYEERARAEQKAYRETLDKGYMAARRNELAQAKYGVNYNELSETQKNELASEFASRLTNDTNTIMTYAMKHIDGFSVLPREVQQKMIEQFSTGKRDKSGRLIDNKITYNGDEYENVIDKKYIELKNIQEGNRSYVAGRLRAIDALRGVGNGTSVDDLPKEYQKLLIKYNDVNEDYQKMVKSINEHSGLQNLDKLNDWFGIGWFDLDDYKYTTLGVHRMGDTNKGLAPGLSDEDYQYIRNVLVDLGSKDATAQAQDLENVRNRLLAAAAKEYGIPDLQAKIDEAVAGEEAKLNEFIEDFNKKHPDTPISYGQDVNGKAVITFGEEDEAFKSSLDDLIKYGDAETAAIEQQTKIMNDHNKRQEDLLAEMLDALGKSEEAQEVLKANEELYQTNNEQQKKRIEAESRHAQQTAALEQMQQRRLLSAQEKTDKWLQDQQEASKRARDRAKGYQEAENNRILRTDQRRAEAIAKQSEARIKNSNAATDYIIAMSSASSGVDVLKARSRLNNEIAYNNQRARIEADNARKLQAAEERGFRDNQEREAFKAGLNERLANLDNQKKIADSFLENMAKVGTLRGLVPDNVGQKSGLVENWERIQAAAFGHIQDPAADAVIRLQRQRSLEHAALMSMLTMTLPEIVRNLSDGNGNIEIPVGLRNAMTGQDYWNRATASFLESVNQFSGAVDALSGIAGGMEG